MSYADLTPNSERTIPGQVFLATNIAYTIVGIILALPGEVLLGFLTDVCSFASFTYISLHATTVAIWHMVVPRTLQ